MITRKVVCQFIWELLGDFEILRTVYHTCDNNQFHPQEPKTGIFYSGTARPGETIWCLCMEESVFDGPPPKKAGLRVSTIFRQAEIRKLRLAFDFSAISRLFALKFGMWNGYTVIHIEYKFHWETSIMSRVIKRLGLQGVSPYHDFDNQLFLSTCLQFPNEICTENASEHTYYTCQIS